MGNILDEVDEADVGKDETCFSIPSEDLYKAIRALKRILPSRKSDMPVDAKESIQFQSQKDELLIWGQRGDQQIQFHFEFDEEGPDFSFPGHFSIPVRPLVKPIRNLKKKTDRFILTADGETVEIDGGIGKFEEDLTYHDDIPPEGVTSFKEELNHKTSLSYTKFKSIIGGAQLASDPEADRRDFLKNILFRSKDKTSILSSDGSIVYHSKALKDWDCTEFGIQSDLLDPPLYIFNKGEDVLLMEGDKCFHVSQGSCIFSVRKSEELDYPPVEKKIAPWKQKAEKEAFCSTKDLKEGIKFLDSLSRKDENVRITAGSSPLQLLSGKAESKRSSYSLSPEDKFKFPTVQVKRKYLQDITKTSKSDRLNLASSSDDDVPLIVKEDKDGGNTWFIMKVASKAS